jgi:hypothetical protein
MLTKEGIILIDKCKKKILCMQNICKIFMKVIVGQKFREAFGASLI